MIANLKDKKQPAAKQAQAVSTIQNEGDEELPDDAEKELPGDQEYSAKADESQDEEDDGADSEVNERPPTRRDPGVDQPALPGVNKKKAKQEVIMKMVNVRFL